MQRLFDKMGMISGSFLAALLLSAPFSAQAQDVPVSVESGVSEGFEGDPASALPVTIEPSPDMTLAPEPVAVEGGHTADPHAATDAAGHAVDHAAEHSSGGLPQLDVTTFSEQLFWLVVTFVILFVLFSKKTIPEISGVLEDRARHIGDNLKSAERLKNEAEEAKAAYDAALTGSRAQAAQISNDVQNTVKAKAESQAREFRAHSEREVEAAEARLEKSRSAVMDEMGAIAAEVASEAASRIIGTSPDIHAAQSIVKSIKVA